MLALYAPFGGNTPTEYLFKNAAYDTDTLALFESNGYDAEAFRQGVQVVVNLISDVDQADAMLPLAADLVERWASRPSTIPARSCGRRAMPSQIC